MDAITGSTSLNAVYMTGNNNINTSNDVMATQNTANETTTATNQVQQNQDAVNAQAVEGTIGSSTVNANGYPENGDQFSVSA